MSGSVTEEVYNLYEVGDTYCVSKVYRASFTLRELYQVFLLIVYCYIKGIKKSKTSFINKNKYRIYSFFRILLLVTAGEGVFILPFVLARIFRPTFLDVFQLDNLQLGTLYSTYGVVALISYLYGGTLADRFQPRILMGTALVMTSIGGFLMSTFPSFYSLQILYGFWGFSTTFLFWAAMIKATRNWGGEQSQGKAFGFLEGGRGIIVSDYRGYWYFNFCKINTS